MRTIAIIVMVILVLPIFGCSMQTISDKPIKVSSKTIEYRPLTKSELRKFIIEKRLEPLAVRDVGNSFTVILFEDDINMGNYSVAVDSRGQISWGAAVSNNNSAFAPVSIAGVATGVPYVTVIINDLEILKKASEVMVKFEDGYEVKEPINNRKGLIIPNESVNNATVSFKTVEIYDEDGQILFHN